MCELVEPIGVIPYSADEPNEAMFALGFTNYWDTYFAGRAAPLGLAPAEVVDALFYNFAPGEVARHIPKVWRTTTPEAAIAARQMGCVKALRRILGDHIDSHAFARAADLLLKAATSAPFEGRPMYAALRAIPIPEGVVARLFHAASLLREHRGDGHIAALMIEGVGGLEAHVLFALDMGMPAENFGRIHHLPAPQLAAVIDRMRFELTHVLLTHHHHDHVAELDAVLERHPGTPVLIHQLEREQVVNRARWTCASRSEHERADRSDEGGALRAEGHAPRVYESRATDTSSPASGRPTATDARMATDPGGDRREGQRPVIPPVLSARP